MMELVADVLIRLLRRAGLPLPAPDPGGIVVSLPPVRQPAAADAGVQEERAA